jgi:hypothetical protein
MNEISRICSSSFVVICTTTAGGVPDAITGWLLACSFGELLQTTKVEQGLLQNSTFCTIPVPHEFLPASFTDHIATPTMQNMDESQFKARRSPTSIYISLQDQEQAETGLEHNLPPRLLKVSKDHKTYVHLAVQQEQHWAAVQISILPFSLQQIPDQKFYSCHFAYTWCCEAPVTTAPPNDVLGSVVQRIYDVYFQPTQWDFSSKHWYVSKRSINLFGSSHKF